VVGRQRLCPTACAEHEFAMVAALPRRFNETSLTSALRPTLRAGSFCDGGTSAPEPCRRWHRRGAKRSEEPLDSCSWFGERHSSGLLHEIVKNGSDSRSDNESAQASDGKGTHLLSPNPLKFVAQFETAWFRSIDKSPCSGRARKGLRFDIHKGSPEQTNS
jgi:hypothetical protein